MKKILLIILSFLMGCLFTFEIYNYKIIHKKQETRAEEVDIKDSINKVYNSVLTVLGYTNSDDISTVGTSFVYKVDNEYAYILTNYHVVKDLKKIKVQNIEENICDATILGFDKYRDIAILKSNKSIALGTVILSDSSKIELGDTVFTIGTPLSKEYYGTLTQGIISYKDRLLQKDMDEEVLIDTIQTTTTINPGNSGGPLFNINGEVIGVISSKIIKNEVEGLGFAIPINDIKPIIEQLENGQDIKRLYTNMDILDLNNDYELYKNELYLDQDYSFGVYVKSIYENSIFSKILQEKDIILKVNGENIKSSKHFEYLINKYNNIKLEVKRNDEIIILDFTN